ncbi:I17RC protein, partial [Brachypteracias leptosomus]|nr:I17RC protein [Brachypteracias leptosomus]
ADAKAWERLWARSRLVLHATGHALSCSLSAPCDLPAELVPCWQPVPTGPCQALPSLQESVVGQGPHDFRGLRLHPNLCVQVGRPLAAPQLPRGQPWALLTHSLGQVRSGGQVWLTQCLRDREYCQALPGRPDDLLLVESGGNANTSLCALEQGTCTPLASFTSTGAGQPGLLEQELRRDVAAGQCWQVSVGTGWALGRDWALCDMSPCPQIWQAENNTGITLWACPLHKYLHARWALVWMGVLLGAACLLLLLLLKKEDVKGECCLSGGCTQPGT